MEKLTVRQYLNKKVKIETKNGFFVTTTMPNNISGTDMTVKDKFGKLASIDFESIASINEVSQ